MRSTAKLAAAAAAIALAVAGCGSGDDDGGSNASGDGSAPASVKLPTIIDQTGVSAFFAKHVQDGMELAVAEANENDALGGTKIELDISDSGSEVKQGVTQISKIVKNDPPLILFGTQGGSALAMAPIAQRAKVPFIVTIGGSPGVVETGEYIYRATAPQSAYHAKQVKHLANEGVKRLAVIYASDSATLAGLGESTYPELAKQNGMEIVSSNGVTSTDTELGSVVSRTMKSNPDAVVMLLIGKQNVSVAKGLRTSGFKGIIAGQYGIGSEALKALGSAAEGILYPADFTPAMDAPSTQAFVKLFEEKVGRAPDLYDANGYVAAQMAIEALKKADGDYTSESLQKALTAVTASGLESATGAMTFEDRDARVDGVLLEWRDGKEHVVTVDDGGAADGDSDET